MKRAVLLTSHFAFQKRRGSILWVSDHLQRTGWHVTHVTVGYSWIGAIRGDKRLSALDVLPKQGTLDVSPNLRTIYYQTPLHPAKTGRRKLDAVINALSPLFRAWWAPILRNALRHSDLVICESGAAVMLSPLLARYASHAPRVYRANDDIRLLNASDALIRAEEDSLPHFTRISTASPHLAGRFCKHSNVTLDPMGVPKAQLNAIKVIPRDNSPAKKIAVCAGTTQLDMSALVRIARSKPAWQVHVLGRTTPQKPDLPNLVWHGEQDFETTLAHVAQADIGLAPYLDKPGVEYQTNNSNRILLYRHFGLPILGPQRLCHPSVPSIVAYPDIDRCDSMTRDPEELPDWSQLAFDLAQNDVISPPTEVASDPAMAT